MSRIEYLSGSVTLYLGDCRDILPTLGKVDNSIAVVTDPPYGTGRYETDNCEAVAPVALQFIGRAPVVIFGYPERLCELAIAVGAVPIEWVTWWPTNTNGASRSELLPRESEHIAIWAETIDTQHIKRPRSTHTFARKMAIQRGLDPDFVRDGDVWRDAMPGTRDHHEKRQHINEKPVSIMKRLIECWPAQTILDPFMGSGTTGVACVQLGRKFIGIEIEEKYFDIACRRIADELRRPRLPLDALKPAVQVKFDEIWDEPFKEAAE